MLKSLFRNINELVEAGDMTQKTASALLKGIYEDTGASYGLLDNQVVTADLCLRDAVTYSKILTPDILLLTDDDSYACELYTHLAKEMREAFNLTVGVMSAYDKSDLALHIKESVKLIVADEIAFDEISKDVELWVKTVFLLTCRPHEHPLTVNEMPLLVWSSAPEKFLISRILVALKELKVL